MESCLRHWPAGCFSAANALMPAFSGSVALLD